MTMRQRMNIWMSLGFLGIGTVYGADGPANPPNAALKTTVQSCGTCHGVDGTAYRPRFLIWRRKPRPTSRRNSRRLRSKRALILMRKPTCGAWHRN